MGRHTLADDGGDAPVGQVVVPTTDGDFATLGVGAIASRPFPDARWDTRIEAWETPARPPEPAPATVVSPPPATARQPQPVLTAAAIQAVLAAVVTIGWVRLDDTTTSTLATVLAGVLALVSAFIARGKVTPVASPRRNDGQPLT